MPHKHPFEIDPRSPHPARGRLGPFFDHHAHSAWWSEFSDRLPQNQPVSLPPLFPDWTFGEMPDDPLLAGISIPPEESGQDPEAAALDEFARAVAAILPGSLARQFAKKT